MNILLFGISNVGKSSTGKVLAQSLGFDFYDLDDEVKKRLESLLRNLSVQAILKSATVNAVVFLKI